MKPFLFLIFFLPHIALFSQLIELQLQDRVSEVSLEAAGPVYLLNEKKKPGRTIPVSEKGSALTYKDKAFFIDANRFDIPGPELNMTGKGLRVFGMPVRGTVHVIASPAGLFVSLSMHIERYVALRVCELIDVSKASDAQIFALAIAIRSDALYALKTNKKFVGQYTEALSTAKIPSRVLDIVENSRDNILCRLEVGKIVIFPIKFDVRANILGNNEPLAFEHCSQEPEAMRNFESTPWVYSLLRKDFDKAIKRTCEIDFATGKVTAIHQQNMSRTELTSQDIQGYLGPENIKSPDFVCELQNDTIVFSGSERRFEPVLDVRQLPSFEDATEILAQFFPGAFIGSVECFEK